MDSNLRSHCLVSAKIKVETGETATFHGEHRKKQWILSHFPHHVTQKKMQQKYIQVKVVLNVMQEWDDYYG